VVPGKKRKKLARAGSARRLLRARLVMKLSLLFTSDGLLTTMKLGLVFPDLEDEAEPTP
jgi:hypothetical protein